MDIKTKFSNGDTVWRAYTNWEPVGQRDCEECSGAGRLKIEGKSLTIACPNRCHSGKFSVYNFAPLAQQLTIGKVEVSIIESPGTINEWGDIKSTDGNGFTNYSPIVKREERYMCIETGIGSGSVYDVEDLFATEAEALERAVWKVADAIAYRKEQDERREKERRMAALELQPVEETEDV